LTVVGFELPGNFTSGSSLRSVTRITAAGGSRGGCWISEFWTHHK
jgi:hypothetical protein